MSNGPYPHVRRPDLPWRESRRTECGRGVNDVAKFISREEARALITEHGIKRAAFLACMTCLTTCRDRDDDPGNALAREFYGTRDPELSSELVAIGLLVAAHREEFDDLIEGLKSTTDLAAARRRAAARRGRAAR